MSQKIIDNIFTLASEKKARQISFLPQAKGLICQLDFPHQETLSFKLPVQLEANLQKGVLQLLGLSALDIYRAKAKKINTTRYQLNLRINVIPDKYGERLVISLLDNHFTFYPFNHLGLQANEKKVFNQALKRRGGLILFSSASRQGRTTTLFSALNELDRDKNLAYFMDLYPEYSLDKLIPIKNNANNWSRVISHDANIIALDDDNPKNLKLALQTAATGRLVLATIEANNALEASYRLLKLNLPWNLILDNLIMITGQSLAKLARANRTDISVGRKQIGLFETLYFDKKLVNFLKNNQARLDEKELWSEVLDLSQSLGYQPLTIDQRLKKEANIIVDL